MKEKRTVRFVGGPLHGNSREVEDFRDRYEVPPEAAGAMGEAMGEATEPSAPPPEGILTYVRRRDGRFYLQCKTPDGVAEFPAGFTGIWFDAGEGMFLAEIHAPLSDFGHAFVDVRISEELLSDPVASQEGMYAFNLAIELIKRKEIKGALRMEFGDLLELAKAVESGGALAEKQGNRRIIAAALKAFAARGSLEG